MTRSLDIGMFRTGRKVHFYWCFIISLCVTEQRNVHSSNVSPNVRPRNSRVHGFYRVCFPRPCRPLAQFSDDSTMDLGIPITPAPALRHEPHLSVSPTPALPQQTHPGGVQPAHPAWGSFGPRGGGGRSLSDAGAPTRVGWSPFQPSDEDVLLANVPAVPFTGHAFTGRRASHHTLKGWVFDSG